MARGKDSLQRFVVLGASGDLTRRYLMPALANLLEAGHLPEELEVIGAARDPWASEEFRTRIERGLIDFAPAVREATRKRLLSALTYTRCDATDPQDLSRLGLRDVPALIYLALPPAVFAPTIRALQEAGADAKCRIVVEKPFGDDLHSAHELNSLLHQAFPEGHVFRLDHFLGKQTVQNILGLRFANRLFEPVWNGQHIARVEITWDETLALEQRAAYYDSAGALKDMVQNHLLQLVALVGMEPPACLTERDLRDRKLEVLRAVRSMSSDEVGRLTVRARYTTGRQGERAISAYVNEEGVDATRRTETFAAAVLSIDNWRWAGVPFRLRTGKALAREKKEIAIFFRPVPHSIFEDEPVPNVLRIEMDPDAMALGVNVNGPGDLMSLERIELDKTLARQQLSAYARLLLDALEGDPLLSIRDDETEESWRIVEPILDGWRAGFAPLAEYAAGSEGPEEAGAL